MLQGISSSLTGLSNAVDRLNVAADNIARASSLDLQPGPPVSGGAAAKSPSDGDLAAGQVQLALAAHAFSANLNALRAQAQLLDVLFDSLDR